MGIGPIIIFMPSIYSAADLWLFPQECEGGECKQSLRFLGISGLALGCRHQMVVTFLPTNKHRPPWGCLPTSPLGFTAASRYFQGGEGPPPPPHPLPLLLGRLLSKISESVTCLQTPAPFCAPSTLTGFPPLPMIL